MTIIKVLYVDDEENNLSSFKANFRRLYEIYTANSGAAALDILSQTKVHVVISDQRMPNMTGVELFMKIRKLYPESIRILLTGYTDIDALANAINDGHIYRYITKPWNEIELNSSIQNAYDVFITKHELKEKLAELQKTNDELNRFIYSISHELRAPLASALGVINLAKLDNIDNESEKSKEYWGLIEECCSRLDYNITNTLQYYKNSRYSIVKESINFQKLTTGLITIHKLANNVGDEIKFDLNVDQYETFIGDTFRIETIIGNLISNAIKYQKPEEVNKSIQVDIKVNLLEATISITDNGVGILSDHIDKIFNQFFRLHNQKGTGLGLFIVKEALAKIEGKISVQSVPNAGTKITVRIPNNISNT